MDNGRSYVQTIKKKTIIANRAISAGSDKNYYSPIKNLNKSIHSINVNVKKKISSGSTTATHLSRSVDNYSAQVECNVNGSMGSIVLNQSIISKQVTTKQVMNTKLKFLSYAEKSYGQIKKYQEISKLKEPLVDKNGRQKQSNLVTIATVTNNNYHDKSITSNKSKFKNLETDIGRKPLVTAPPMSQQKEIISMKIKKLFKYFCQFSGNNNLDNMSLSNFQKFVIDSRLNDNKLNLLKFEYLFQKEIKNKTYLDYDGFLKLLTNLAQLKYDDNIHSMTGASEGLKKIIQKHLNPLYDNLFGKSEDTKSAERGKTEENKAQLNNSIGNVAGQSRKSSNSFLRNEEDNFQIDDDITDLLMKICPVFLEIYIIYFPWEINSIKDNLSYIRENSSKAFNKFVTDFDLTPHFITKATSSYIFQVEVIKSESSEVLLQFMQEIFDKAAIKKINPNSFGHLFTFSKFLYSICRIANATSDRIFKSAQRTKDKIAETKTLTLYQKICLTIERIELSDNFINLSFKTSASTKKMKILPKEFYETLRKEIESQTEIKTNGDRVRNSMRTNYKEFCENSLAITDKYGDMLLEIFKYYCSFGDSLNTEFMKSQKFYKLLKEANLLKNTAKLNYGFNKSKGYESAEIKDLDSSVTSNKLYDNYGIKQNDIDLIFLKINRSKNLVNTTISSTSIIRKFSMESNLSRNPSNSSLKISPEMNENDLNLSKRDSFSSSPKNLARSGSNNSLTNSIKRSFTKKLSINSGFQNASPLKKLSNSVYDMTTPIPEFSADQTHSSSNKMDYNGFINAIEIIASMIRPDLNLKDAIELVISKHLLPLHKKTLKKATKYFENLYKEKEDNNFDNVSHLIQKNFKMIFKFYSKSETTLTFDQFLKFSIDFQIFPDYVSRAKLLNFFKEGMDNISIFDLDNCEGEVINYDIFVDLFCLCALEVAYNDELMSYEKVLKFVEKLLLSDKIINISRSSKISNIQNLNVIFRSFKTKFPDYFEEIHLFEKEKGFFDILEEEGLTEIA